MSSVTAVALRSPLTVARHGARRGGGRECPAISVFMSQKAQSEQAWVLTLKAKTESGFGLVGKVLTAPPSSLRPASRVVAMAACPGAFAWVVEARPFGALQVAGGLLGIDETPDLFTPGVTPLDGSLLLNGAEDAGRYNHATGVVPGAATVPAGATVDSYSVAAGGAAATVAIVGPFGALPLVTVPAGASLLASPLGLKGPCSLTFGGTLTTWLATWRELA